MRSHHLLLARDSAHRATNNQVDRLTAAAVTVLSGAVAAAIVTIAYREHERVSIELLASPIIARKPWKIDRATMSLEEQVWVYEHDLLGKLARFTIYLHFQVRNTSERPVTVLDTTVTIPYFGVVDRAELYKPGCYYQFCEEPSGTRVDPHERVTLEKDQGFERMLLFERSHPEKLALDTCPDRLIIQVRTTRKPHSETVYLLPG